MTREESPVQTILTVAAVLFAIPLLMMGVVMPLAVLTGLGHVPFGSGGWRILMPVVPLIVSCTIGYILYTGVSEESEETDDELEALRLADARGELTETDFETRRVRVRSGASAEPRAEASTDD